MPTGTVTVTPGQVFTNEDLTATRMNALGLPTMAVGSGAISKRELNRTELGTALTPARTWQLFRNAEFAGDTWRDPATGISCAAGERTDNAAGWICEPAGAALNYARGTFTAATGAYTVTGIKYGAELTGAASVTTVNFGQFVPPEITRFLKGAGTLTISFAIEYQGGIGSGFGIAPKALIQCAQVSGQGSSVVERYLSSALTGTAELQSKFVSHTADVSGLEDFENGAFIGLQFPSGTLVSGQSVVIGAFRLEIAATASAWVTPSARDIHGPATVNRWNATTDPDWNNDSTEGYGYGSRWRNGTDNTVWTCLDAAVGAAVWRKLSENNPRYGLWLYQQATTVEGGDIKTAPTLSDRIPWNTEVLADARAAALNGTDVELLAKGTYRVRAVQTCYRCQAAQLQHYNKTAQVSNVGRSPSATAVCTGLMRYDQVERITATPPIDVELIPDAAAARATDGLGLAANSGGPEIYGILEVEWLPETVPDLAGFNPASGILIWDENVDLATVTYQSAPDFRDLMYANQILLIGQEDATENGVYLWDFGGTELLTRFGSPYVASYYTKRAFIDKRGRGLGIAPSGDWRVVIQVETITTLDTDPMVFVEQDGYNCLTVTT